jgi:hypothetical protein
MSTLRFSSVSVQRAKLTETRRFLTVPERAQVAHRCSARSQEGGCYMEAYIQGGGGDGLLGGVNWVIRQGDSRSRPLTT